MQPADDPVPPDADDKIEPGASSQIATEREGNYDEFPAAASEVETEVRANFAMACPDWFITFVQLIISYHTKSTKDKGTVLSGSGSSNRYSTL